jgi:hypothetical protein
MNPSINEKVQVKVLALGVAVTTLLVMTGPVTDPVNAPKFLVLGALAMSLLGIMIVKLTRNVWAENKAILAILFIFVTGLVVSSFLSESPFTQNLYGVYGRNTGLLSYFFLAVVALGSSILRAYESFRLISFTFVFCGLANIAYSIWVITLGDPISWNNPYGAILGTFGNPNFISSFLGMTCAALMSMVLKTQLSWGIRSIFALCALLSFYEITKTASVQGYVVAAAGVTFVLFLKLRSLSNQVYSYFFAGVASLLGLLAVLGTFQVGPLTRFIYQGTLAFRGQYWRAGINMGNSDPLTGVGADSYGNYYRMFRDPQALITPGVKTVTNSAHNVILDLFSSGGYVVALSYLALFTYGLLSIIKVMKRQRKFDEVYAILACVWFTYQLQSIISINQLGLAIWGWVTTGLLIAYEHTTRSSENISSTQLSSPQRGRSQQSMNSIISPQLVAGIGILVGILIALPPLNADMKWRSALESQNANKVIASLQPSYLNPLDSQRLSEAVQVFASSNLLPQAHDAAIKGVEFSPDYFDAWRVLYFLSNSTDAEKALAFENMKRLDPLNPDVLAQ